MFNKPHKFEAMHLKIYKGSALDPLSKVLELLKSNNFTFGKVWSYMEEIGEKFKWKQSNTKYNWISESSQKSPKFRSLYLQIFWVLDKTSNIKVVGIVLSVVQNLREKAIGKSIKLKTLNGNTWTV